MSTLHRLVYYSRSRIEGGPSAVAAAVAQILAASRANNVRAGVTGALLFNHGCFAQVLEGPQAAVETTFERIQQDPRHGEVALLGFGAVTVSGFPTWSMAYVGDNARHRESYRGIAEETGFDFAALTGERIFEILHAMVLEEDRAAA